MRLKTIMGFVLLFYPSMGLAQATPISTPASTPVLGAFAHPADLTPIGRPITLVPIHIAREKVEEAEKQRLLKIKGK